MLSGRGVVVGMAVLLMGAAPAVAQGRYTEDQMRLAGQIGAVIGMVKLCGIVPMPAAAVQAATRAAGLRDRDMTDPSTAFRGRVQEQANTVVTLAELQKRQGMSEREVSAQACRQMAEMYGPNGSIKRGLVPAR